MMMKAECTYYDARNIISNHSDSLLSDDLVDSLSAKNSSISTPVLEISETKLEFPTDPNCWI
jgi:hypothetical protein